MKFIALAASAFIAAGAAEAADLDAARAMYARLVAFDSSTVSKATPALAKFLKGELVTAGFPASDIEIGEAGASVYFIARWRADAPKAKPVALLAHMDVVPADPKDWDKPPFELTEQDGVLYGRGTVDNKLGVLALTRAFIELKAEGFTPDRDLILAFSGDEETEMLTTRALVEKLKGEIAYAVNSDAGGGYVSKEGRAAFFVQAAEKTYATFLVTATNSGGHSSAPRADNAIYDLASALKKVETLKFPVRWNDVSLANFRATAAIEKGEVRDALLRFVKMPGDKKAVKRLEKEDWINRDLRTTCVATMLNAGHAENALPQRATATVNCRIFPGETAAETRAALERAVGNDAIAIALEGDALESPVSRTPDEVSAALAKTLAQLKPGAVATPYQEAGGTDGLHFRRAGITTVGIGPQFSAEGVEYNYHGRNERIPVAEFEEAMKFYPVFLRALAGGV
jgi:acetylornithine deacetylase/succinyl-diaminopimelate desuccinylase-like protein